MFMIFLFKPLSILFFAAFWFNGRDATFFCQYIANILVKGNENKEDLKAEYQKKNKNKRDLPPSRSLHTITSL